MDAKIKARMGRPGAIVGLLVLAAAVLAIGIGATRRRTSVVLDAPYDLVEWQAFSSLGLDRDELIAARHAQSHARGQVRSVLTMDLHTHRLLAYEPDAHIHFRGNHRYNIMATGGEKLEVEIRRVTPNKTKVTVDYFEATRLFGVIPVTWCPGWSQERRLIEAMFAL